MGMTMISNLKWELFPFIIFATIIIVSYVVVEVIDPYNYSLQVR
jgi:hypothetical protein